MEREPIRDDSPDRLAGDDSPARISKAAQREDGLSPAKDLRDRVATSRSERVGDGTAVGGDRRRDGQPQPGTLDAICDRLLHNANRIVLKGPSRRKEAKLEN